MDVEPPFVDPVMFQNITESTIANGALRTRGSSGPSGLDADGWRRILVLKNFAAVSHSLRNALVNIAQKISTTEIEVIDSNGRIHTNLEAYTVCRPIPIDKSPGVGPIGVGEVLPRLLGKLHSTGGCEAAVHAMSDIFQETTDALLLVDAYSAPNSLN